MTGFARSAGEFSGTSFGWEAKSVNAKGLDVRLRLPGGTDALEPQLRERVGRRFKRGSVSIGLELKRTAPTATISVDRALLDRLLQLNHELSSAGKVARGLPSFEALLAIKGVMETVDEPTEPEDEAARDAALLAGFDRALDQLAEARAAEGARLTLVLNGQVDAIAALTARAREIAAAVPEKIADRLRRQVAALSDSVPQDRLAQEIALLAGRADATEELDRLDSHVASARALLASGEAVGRRLDFLAQEFHREANTLTAKSGDIGLTHIGIELKTAIEQFREQVQNVE